MELKSIAKNTGLEIQSASETSDRNRFKGQQSKSSPKNGNKKSQKNGVEEIAALLNAKEAMQEQAPFMSQTLDSVRVLKLISTIPARSSDFVKACFNRLPGVGKLSNLPPKIDKSY